MSVSGQSAAYHASQYWKSLVAVAQFVDFWKQIPEIAAAAGVSEESIERRMDAIRFFLSRGTEPEQIAEWGQSQTMSAAKREKSLQRGEGKPAKRFCLEVPEDLHADLCKQRERLGGLGICMAEYINAHLLGLSNEELCHEAGLSK